VLEILTFFAIIKSNLIMELTISKAVFGIRPNVTMPDKRILDVLGENGVRQLISNQYDCLFKSEVSHLFPTNDVAREKAKLKSSDFFIQILGGRPYFNENQGSPMMTRRHMPFKITPEARIVWLNCYKKVLLNSELEENLILSFWQYLNVFSMWMVNTPE
jgi:hemoglobin